MAKYSFEKKKELVLAYLSGRGSCEHLGNSCNITHSVIRRWVLAYKEFGDEGLFRSRKNITYTFDFKLHVVELYLTTEISYQELALSVGINNPPLITKWVNDFRIAGPDALRAKQKGRKSSLKTPKKAKSEDQPIINSADNNTERIKQLENELLKLKIENAYLKELRRLRLEEEALLKKKRESSKASEENSD